MNYLNLKWCIETPILTLSNNNLIHFYEPNISLNIKSVINSNNLIKSYCLSEKSVTLLTVKDIEIFITIDYINFNKIKNISLSIFPENICDLCFYSNQLLINSSKSLYYSIEESKYKTYLVCDDKIFNSKVGDISHILFFNTNYYVILTDKCLTHNLDKEKKSLNEVIMETKKLRRNIKPIKEEEEYDLDITDNIIITKKESGSLLNINNLLILNKEEEPDLSSKMSIFTLKNNNCEIIYTIDLPLSIICVKSITTNYPYIFIEVNKEIWIYKYEKELKIINKIQISYPIRSIFSKEDYICIISGENISPKSFMLMSKNEYEIKLEIYNNKEKKEDNNNDIIKLLSLMNNKMEEISNKIDNLSKRVDNLENK